MEHIFATNKNVKIGDKVLAKDIITCKYTNQRTVTESILAIIKQEPDYAILIQNK